ncbi:MAG: PEP-CTERM sorting domain-containing protein [Nitrospirae bacterium]|nr:PEP-CTERM sorting domain-containing protein [Nitrospirota bacterium]
MKKVIMIFVLLTGIVAAELVNADTLFLDDWGVTPGVWTPTSGPSHIEWISEDFTDAGTGYVGPGSGGQPFDAEAAYIGIQGTKIYVAVVTGMPQTGSKDPWRYDNPAYTSYDWNRSLEKYWVDPGDIGLDMGNDGIYEFAITTRPDNSKSSHTPTAGAGRVLSGNLIWTDPRAWSTTIGYTEWGGISDPWAVNTFDNAISLGSNFRYGAFGTDHYAIEAIIDNSLLGLNNGDLLTLHWTMECGNDYLHLLDPVSQIPEPSTFILLGSGLMWFIRKRIRK